MIWDLNEDFSVFYKVLKTSVHYLINTSAIVKQMPEPPPVMNATFPLKNNIIFNLRQILFI